MTTADALKALEFGTVRVSQRGVPHVVHEGYSVVWFGRTKVYRVFWPWPGVDQRHRDFGAPEAVREFLKVVPR